MLALADRGYVSLREERPDASWFFTASGIRALTRCTVASQPKPVFEVRSGIPLQDQSTYEQAVMLERAGWTWKPWVPPSARRRPSGENRFVGLARMAQLGQGSEW